ncbi:MAG: hypothetical protein COX07_04350 [Bacteroidetes bacterium CG23_combo_of_CG06-09_8_20_14_all_32_9]|nr:MAG: hypothetical protein COX07_04350 [Bacteroidetes bacterium CG23_combo_of_CG06-09_8_20_14_all_32_9]
MNKQFVSISLILTLCLSFSLSSIAQEVNENESIILKMAQAWLRYNDEDYNGAMRIYRELYKLYPENAQLNFRMGQCYIESNKMDSALTHLYIATQIDTTIKNEAYFLLGKIYQYMGDLDKAIENFYKYKSKLTPKQNERDFANVLLQQCFTAKELMANPVNVKISNPGTNINTKFVDACPSITADGKTLLFTSRRPENTGGKIDPYTEDYYDDIYISTFNNATKEWNPAKNIGAPLNTETHDANMSISPDGNTIYTYKNAENVTKSGDIYYSTRKPTGEWGDPRKLEGKYVNTSFFESSACVTPDGNTMFFVSENVKDGFGHGDIYMVKKEGKEWGKPVNLGSPVNTVYDEIGVYIHPDGKTLLFSSNGHKTMGGYDIFISNLSDDGRWSEPINIGYPINTTRDEIHFVLGTDHKTAYISSNRDHGYGSYDIYNVDMSYYFESNKNIPANIASAISGSPLSILKGKVTDAETNQPIIANIIIKDLVDNKTDITESDENGEYFITLPADKKYEIIVKTKGYKSLNVKFKLPKGEKDTYTMVKHLLLTKE